MNEIKQKAVEWLNNREETFRNMAKQIWQQPELGLNETYASTLQQSILQEEGFGVVEQLGGMDTAFYAEYGEGEPVIGVLGEFDALPGLSQNIKPKKEPLVEGGPGHGCGHNLLGTAGVASVIAIKHILQTTELQGTVRYYGCPAEETLIGKVYMAKDGIFDELDACLTWHPGDVNCTSMSSSLAVNSAHFNFSGVPAHAAVSPEQGRSALDGVELMNIGTEYMREHISDKARVHYSILKGGEEPNVVPPEAACWYYVRAPKREEVDRLYQWILQIADGAAKMGQVDVKSELLTACYNYLPNNTLSEIVLDNMKELGGPNYSEDDKDFAAQLADTFTPGQKETLEERGVPENVRTQTLHSTVLEEPYDAGQVGSGSTDLGDVSWIVPVAQFTAATWPLGTAGHTWQVTASTGSGIGLTGMHFAAKTLTNSLIDLYSSPNTIKKAQEEFNEQTDGNQYESPLPAEATPRMPEIE